VRGEFMAGFGIADAFDFEDWLEGKRESVRRDLDTVLHRLARLQAGNGRLEAALATARRRVKADSLNEAAHRTVIELQLEAGDRAGAFESYRVCHDLLRQELGIPPAPETEALIRQVRANGNSTASDFAEASSGHIAVLSRAIAQPEDAAAPFVGRARELELLEQAWNKGLIAFVSGDPGSGKSRLMHEFMHGSIHHQAFISLENRPGDAGVPYASLARHLRAILKAQPVTLEVWVTNELARILPEYGEAPAPIQSEQGKLRFYQAITETFQTAIRANQILTALLYDDAQFTDTSSAEATRFVLEQLEPDARTQLRILYGYRKNELPAELEANLKQSLLTGEGLLIELEPLPASALEALLQALNLNIQTDDLGGVSRTLEQFTGGNPLFVLETVKSLTEAQHGQQWTAMDLETMRSENRLPKSSKVKQVIEQRLERLTKPARDLLRVAAVMGQEYTLERAAKVLEANQLVLAEASEELEVVGFVRQERFTHDLLFEASLENVPRAAKPLLHSRVLDVLEVAGIPAAVLVKHAYASDRHKSVVRFGLQAAQEAQYVWAPKDALNHLERLRDLFLQVSANGDYQDAFSIEKIFEMYRLLRRFYGWSLNIAQARIIADEHLKLMYARQVTEEIAGLLCYYGFAEFGDGVYTQMELLQFSKQALSLAQKSGGEDLLSVAESAISLNIAFQSNPEGDLYTLKLLAVDHAKKALCHAENFAKSDVASCIYIPGMTTKKDVIVLAHVYLSFALGATNLFQDVEFYQEKAMHLDDASDGPQNPCLYRYQLALTKIRLGKLPEAERLSHEALGFVDRWVRARQFPAYNPLFSVYAQSGKYIQIEHTLQLLEDTSSEDSAKRLFRKYEGLMHFARGGLVRARDTWIVGLMHEQQLQKDSQHQFFESALCAVSVLLGNWATALENAQKAVSARDYRALPFPESCDYWHFETIALLHAGEVEVAYADIQARAPHVTKWRRYLLPHLRSEAVLDRHDQKIDTALEKLSRALTLAKEIGLPRETWEIEAEIAHLHDTLHHTDLAAAARSRAMTIRDALAANIPDETMNRTYLEFTQKQIDLPIWKWHADDTQA
jgi:Bacterial transcriptional activator domain/AAA ATPase domain